MMDSTGLQDAQNEDEPTWFRVGLSRSQFSERQPYYNQQSSFFGSRLSEVNEYFEGTACENT